MSTSYILNYSIDFLYVVCDKDGLIISGNELFKQYVSHIKPKKINDIFFDSADLQDMVDSVQKSKEKSPEPIRFYAKTKQKTTGNKWVLWNVYSILDSLHFVGSQLVDVTSITSHDYERQKTLLEEFRFMLSHEIRQPLTSISGLVNMASKPNMMSETEHLDVLKMLEDSVSRLDESIRILVKKAAREI